MTPAERARLRPCKEVLRGDGAWACETCAVPVSDFAEHESARLREAVLSLLADLDEHEAAVAELRARIEKLEAALKKTRGAFRLVKEAASAVVTDIKRGSLSTAKDGADAVGWNARDGIGAIDAALAPEPTRPARCTCGQNDSDTKAWYGDVCPIHPEPTGGSRE